MLSIHCTVPQKRTSLSSGERAPVEHSRISSGLIGVSKEMCPLWHKAQVFGDGRDATSGT